MLAKPNAAESIYEKLPALDDAPTPRPWLWSIAGVIVAVIALGLASLPAFAFDRPLPHPFAATPKEKPAAEPPSAKTRDTSGGVVLKYKKWSVSLRGKKPPEEKPAEAAPTPPPPVLEEEVKLTRDPVRWLTMAAVSMGLAGLVVASVGQLREKHTSLTACAMIGCAAAISWQYLAMGIALGIAAAVCIILLAVILSVFG